MFHVKQVFHVKHSSKSTDKRFTLQTMPITVRLTGPLRPLADGRDRLIVSVTTVGEALQAAVVAHPALRARLFDRQGGLRSEMRVYVNDDDLRLREGLATVLLEGDEITLVAPQAAG